MGDNNLYGYPSFHWNNLYDLFDTGYNWNNWFISEDEQFDLWLRALAQQLSYSDDGNVDDWYVSLKYDPDYDYRAFYDNEIKNNIIHHYIGTSFPLEYVRTTGYLGRQYMPELRYKVGNGNVIEILNPFANIDDSQEYLNQNMPGKIAYRKDKALQKTIMDILNSNRYAIIDRCKRRALESGLTLLQTAALLGNGFLESSFFEENLNNIYLMRNELYNVYSKWLNGRSNTPENLTEFVAKALTHKLGNKHNAYKYMNTSYSNVDLSIRDLHDTDIDAYNKQYGDQYHAAFSNPMSRGLTNELALDWFNNGSLNDMTVAIASLLEKPKLDKKHHYGKYSDRMNYANVFCDLFGCEENEPLTKLQLEILESGNRAFKLGGLLPKRNVLPLI